MQIEILTEEPSMEAFLHQILPIIVGDRCFYQIYSLQGKSDLIKNLDARLRGYAKWIPSDWRIIVIVDRDSDDCSQLKSAIVDVIDAAGLRSRKRFGTDWQVGDCIAIEELEAWYFGEWSAVRGGFPRVAANTAKRSAYRDCDGIKGGTWEAFERELQSAGYFEGGLRKLEAARSVGAHFRPEACSSRSFQRLDMLLREALVAGEVMPTDEPI